MIGSSDTTVSHSNDAGSVRQDEAVALRWVFPLPPLPPCWLLRDQVVIGRDEACAVRLPSAQVSRRHASIERSGALWIVSDMGSKNGLALNGVPAQCAVVSPGDVLRIGDFVAVATQAPRDADLGFESLGHGILGGRLHRAALESVKELAGTGLPVVVQGETGTGKELFARALHEESGRKGPFLAVNCAVYSKAIAAAELFGYRKGAFTGAEHASAGHVRAAEGGTLFLDELLELPLDVQAMLLRTIENREVLPLGESRPFAIDVRFVAATQIPLNDAMVAKTLRSDLRARLEGGLVRLPNLSECREIIPELFYAIFSRQAEGPPELDAGSVEQLCLQDWPLNIRAIDTLARRMAVAQRAGKGLSAALRASMGSSAEKHQRRPSSAPPSAPAGVPGRRSENELYDRREVEALLQALTVHRGNVSKAAQAVGISRQKAYRILRAAKASDA